MAYNEFGKLLKQLMEGEAIVYISDFISSSMVKYDKVSVYSARDYSLYYTVQNLSDIFIKRQYTSLLYRSEDESDNAVVIDRAGLTRFSKP